MSHAAPEFFTQMSAPASLIPPAQDNMVCGACLRIVVPKYPDKKPSDYFRCSMCRIAFHQGSCAGSNDWFRLDRNQRAVWKCLPCQDVAKAATAVIGPVKPVKAQTKRKRSSKTKSKKSSSSAFDSQTSTSQQASASDNEALSPSSQSPSGKKLKCGDDDPINSSVSEYSESETEEAGATPVDFAQPFPDEADQKKCNLHIMSGLATLTKLVQLSREDTFDSRIISNKILEENEALRNECSSLRAKCEGYESRFTELENLVHANTARIESTEIRLDEKDSKDQVKEHKHRLLDDYGRVANVIISDTPPAPTVKDAVAIIRSLASKIKLDITHKDIFRCHALPDRNGMHRIICRFTSGLMKESFAKEIKLAGLTPHDMGWSNSTKQLQVSDHLSPDTAALLAMAKKKLLLAHKVGNFKHVWVKDGRVLARVRDNTPFIEIKCYDDIEKAAQYGLDTLQSLSRQPALSQPTPMETQPVNTDGASSQ